MDNRGGVRVTYNNVSAEDVISKLKDDGDFDNLRLKIIRKLKDNAELRNNIISIIKQSAAINRPGAENMKPRQLSDAIHQEVGDKMMSQISDGVWEIIRSGDGMKTEITETVQLVYNKLVNPKGIKKGESSLHTVEEPLNNVSSTTSVMEVDESLSDSELKEPPGFSMHNLHQNNNKQGLRPKKELQLPRPNDRMASEECKEEAHQSQDASKPANMDLIAPPGFSEVMRQEQPCDSDEDPDVPPGFS